MVSGVASPPISLSDLTRLVNSLADSENALLISKNIYVEGQTRPQSAVPEGTATARQAGAPDGAQSRAQVSPAQAGLLSEAATSLVNAARGGTADPLMAAGLTRAQPTSLNDIAGSLTTLTTPGTGSLSGRAEALAIALGSLIDQSGGGDPMAGDGFIRGSLGADSSLSARDQLSRAIANLQSAINGNGIAGSAGAGALAGSLGRDALVNPAGQGPDGAGRLATAGVATNGNLNAVSANQIGALAASQSGIQVASLDGVRLMDPARSADFADFMRGIAHADGKAGTLMSMVGFNAAMIPGWPQPAPFAPAVSKKEAILHQMIRTQNVMDEKEMMEYL
ncbi:MAG: hypothetical protein AAGE89_17890, partial [Pseudomonadota bacterium]